MTSRNNYLGLPSNESKSTSQIRLFTTSQTKQNSSKDCVKPETPQNNDYTSEPYSLNSALQKMRREQKERKLALELQQIGLSSRNTTHGNTTLSIFKSPNSRDTSQNASRVINLPNSFTPGNQGASRLSSSRNSIQRVNNRMMGGDIKKLETGSASKSRQSVDKKKSFGSLGMFKTQNISNKYLFESAQKSQGEKQSANESQTPNQYSTMQLLSYEPSNKKQISSKEQTQQKKPRKKSKEMFSSNFLQQIKGNKEEGVKTIEIDLKAIRQKHIQHAKTASNAQLSISQSNKSIKVVGRIDKYQDNVQEVLDESLIQVAALMAMKKKIEEDIFERSKQYQGLMCDISVVNRKNIELQSKIGFANEHQRHLQMVVGQLEKQVDDVDQQRNDKFQAMKNELKAMSDQKLNIKKKVKKDTEMTSVVIKEMEMNRAKSIDRVSLLELKDDEALRSVSSLRSKLERGSQVEQNRTDMVKSKEDILKNLIYKGGNGLEIDPKCYLKQKITRVMIEVSKSKDNMQKQRSFSTSSIINQKSFQIQ